MAGTTVERIQGIAQQLPLYTDDWFVGVWLLCTLLLGFLLSDKNCFVGKLFKGFFIPRGNDEGEASTGSILRKRAIMQLISFLTMALLAAAYVVSQQYADLSGHLSDSMSGPLSGSMSGFFSGSMSGDLLSFLPGALPVPLLLLLSLLVLLLGYLLKQVLFHAVNLVFFDQQHSLSWRNTYRDWLMVIGIVSYLLATVAVFLDLSHIMIAILAVIGVALAEICLFFRTFYIFCPKKHGVLQLIVYLCTLEIMPLLLAGKALTNYL